MPESHAHGEILLDHVHSRAVCDGIAAPLRDSLAREPLPLSPRLYDLIAQLPALDESSTPSILPPEPKTRRR